MATVLFGETTVSLKGELPAVNDPAPDFTFVKQDFSEGSLYDFGDKTKVVLAVPSLDTGVCQAETRKFNEELANRDNVVGIVISMDLPFTLKRFCEGEGIENVIGASDFRYHEFGDKYQTIITEGGFHGLSARAVFVIDGSNTIRYIELVPSVGSEPDYSAALSAVDSI